MELEDWKTGRERQSERERERQRERERERESLESGSWALLAVERRPPLHPSILPVTRVAQNPPFHSSILPVPFSICATPLSRRQRGAAAEPRRVIVIRARMGSGAIGASCTV